MDREKRVVRQLVDTEAVFVVQYFGVIQISDNCKNQRYNHASCAPFHVVVETIGPEIRHRKSHINYSCITFHRNANKVEK